jgi:hypothetical protein
MVIVCISCAFMGVTDVISGADKDAAIPDETNVMLNVTIMAVVSKDTMFFNLTTLNLDLDCSFNGFCKVFLTQHFLTNAVWLYSP